MTTTLLTTDEVREAIGALTMADLVRLKKAGALYAVGVGAEATDVINEAVCRALDGVRNCPSDLPVVVFLIGVMRSIASSQRTKAKEQPVVLSLSSTDEDGPAVLEPRAEGRNVEELLIARDDSEARLSALEDLFADDEEIQLILMGDLDEMSAEEIRALGGWDIQAYATIRRRMRRKIAARYPMGWIR